MDKPTYWPTWPHPLCIQGMTTLPFTLEKEGSFSALSDTYEEDILLACNTDLQEIDATEGIDNK